MSIPDAPWVGKCKEDYYGYEDEPVRCDFCGERFSPDELTYYEGEMLCEDCLKDRQSEENEEEGDDEDYD